MACGGENEIWSASFSGNDDDLVVPEAHGGQGWRVLRESRGAWRLEGSALRLGVLPGGTA